MNSRHGVEIMFLTPLLKISDSDTNVPDYVRIEVIHKYMIQDEIPEPTRARETE